MTIRTSATAGAQHGLESLSTNFLSQAQAHDSQLTLSADNASNNHITERSQTTENPSSKCKRSTKPANRHPDRSCYPKPFESTTMTPDTLEDYLTCDTLRQLHIEPANLTNLRSASLDPPVTKASLSELDLVRIINDPKLRHDLNFEREISFRPNVSGPRGQQKEAGANVYWDALVIEFALYIKRRHEISCTSNAALQNTSPWISGSPLSQQITPRLPRMFTTIREILKTLVPGRECFGVDQRLDVDLLMQELDNGACDVKELSNWLRTVLLGSCSPLRDNDVEKMVSVIHEGVDKDDARILVDGLKILFGILETMKLDVANHQIRYLRLLLIDDSINFEQNNFLRKISEGWDVEGARDWFAFQGENTAHGDNRLPCFTRAVVGLVGDSTKTFPTTLGHDVDRLLVLRTDFYMELYQEACNQAFADTLQRLGWIGMPPSNSYSRMLTRILALIDGRGRRNPAACNREVALEVVQEAYNLCSFKTLPDERLVTLAQLHLQQATNLTSTVYGETRDLLGNDLADLVDQEVKELLNLTPLQMLNHLNPGPLGSETTCGMHGLSNIAKRTAHIAVLHWRIWAPILYEQPQLSKAAASELSGCPDVLSLAGLSPQGALAELVEEGPGLEGSRESPKQGTTEELEPSDSSSRSGESLGESRQEAR